MLPPPGDLSGAIKLLQTQLDAASQNEEEQRTLGAALLRAGKPKDAITPLLKAIEIRGEPFPLAWLFLAIAYQKADMKDDARKWLDKAKAHMSTPKFYDDLDWMEKLKLKMLTEEAERTIAASQ